MIFVTVGTQLPFDRMISAIDDWAGFRTRKDVFAQVGNTSFKPANIDWVRSLDQPAFKQRIREASLIISHAGMGTILSAIDNCKPIVVMPRKASFGEHRNDHQLATTRELGRQGLIKVAEDTDGLIRALDNLDLSECAPSRRGESGTRLRRFVRSFVMEPCDA